MRHGFSSNNNRACGHHASEKEIEDCTAKLAVQNGRIGFDTFSQVVGAFQPEEQPNTLNGHLKVMDLEDTGEAWLYFAVLAWFGFLTAISFPAGSISKEDLASLLTTKGDALSAEEAEAFLQSLGVSGDSTTVADLTKALESHMKK